MTAAGSGLPPESPRLATMLPERHQMPEDVSNLAANRHNHDVLRARG